MLKTIWVVGLAALLSSHRAEALAPEECQVRVLSRIIDDLGNRFTAGSILPVDIERSNQSGGAFCASGGSCLPRRVNGRKALVLLNCDVGSSIGGGDFRLRPVPRLAGSQAAGRMQALQNVTAKLSGFGFSNASAGSLADAYVNSPGSWDAKMVAKALEGSKAALATLRQNNP